MSWSQHGDGQEMTVANLIALLSTFGGDDKIGIGGPSGDVSFIATVVQEDGGGVVSIEIGDCIYTEENA